MLGILSAAASTSFLFPFKKSNNNGWYGDGAGNTVEENSSVFSLI